jgi:hypothetical protein
MANLAAYLEHADLLILVYLPPFFQLQRLASNGGMTEDVE